MEAVSDTELKGTDHWIDNEAWRRVRSYSALTIQVSPHAPIIQPTWLAEREDVSFGAFMRTSVWPRANPRHKG